MNVQFSQRGGDTPIATPEVEVEATEETSSTRPAVSERSQGIYASEASRPMTLEAMFERQEMLENLREEERNTPEYGAEAEKKRHTKKAKEDGWNTARKREFHMN